MKDLVKGTGDYLKGVRGEFHKISWPDVHELMDSTVVVISFIVILSATTLVYDQVIQLLIKFVHAGT